MFSGSHETKGHFAYEASRHDHEYGEIISSINFEQEIFEKIEESHLRNGLESFLIDTGMVSGKPEGNITKKRARMKAQEMLNGEGMSKKEIIQIVEEAIESGYIWNFQLEQPWHPKIFMDDNRLTTFPFQHKFIVGYSGKPKHIFFSKEGKKYVKDKANIDEFYNPQSILVQGRIEGSSNHKDAKKGKSNPNNQHRNETKDVAVWFSCLEEAKSYPLGHRNAGENEHGAGVRAGAESVRKEDKKGRQDYGEVVYNDNIVLEVCVPSGFTVQHNRFERWENTKDLKEKFRSPLDYKKVMKNNWTKTDRMDFKTALMEGQSEGEAYLPIKYIDAVWDKEKFPNTPYFMHFKNYIKFLYQKYPSRMPPNSRTQITVPKRNLNTERQERALEKFKEWKKRSLLVIDAYKMQFHHIKKRSRLTIEEVNKGEGADNLKSAARHLNYLISSMEKAEKGVKSKRRGIKKEFGVNIGSPTVCLKEIFLQEVKSNTATKMFRECEEFERYIFDEEKKAYEKIEDGEEINLEKIEEKILAQVKNELEKIPIIKMSDQDLKFLLQFLEEEFDIREENITLDGDKIQLKNMEQA